ncbi:MAG: DUF2764 domain-containing protein [Cytophagaceae bacterium]|jgi:hypothetical protein|nr:DUF2764 domain-containing protein [Cytophagaceae bacterium]
MTKRNYYCLIAGLPELVADEKKLSFTAIEFREMLRDDLSPADFNLATLYYLPYDNKNLLNLLFKKDAEWDVRGNYPKEFLEQIADRKQYELAEDIELPPYMCSFLEQFYSESGIDSYYAVELTLTARYYDYLVNNSCQFVREVAEYDRTVGNIMAALSGRKYKMAYENTLVGDDDLTQSIRKNRTRDFGLSGEVDDIETLVQIYETVNPVEREFKLDQYRWQHLDDSTFFNYFSIEKILVYIRKLFIAERWYSLDRKKGQQMFNRILNELRAGFQMPDEFATAYGKKKNKDFNIETQ